MVFTITFSSKGYIKALLTKGNNLAIFSSEALNQPKISILDMIEITGLIYLQKQFRQAVIFDRDNQSQH